MNGLFACALLAAAHHHVTAHHGYCSDHGELIHLDAQHQAAPRPQHGTGVFGDHHVQGAHACAVLAFTSQTIRTSPARATTSPRARDDHGAYLGPRASHRTVDLLRQAPRLPPPAAPLRHV